MMALMDTNVLIRFFTSDNTQKFRGVYTLFESLEHGDLRVELKLIVLFQVVFPREDIATGMLGILEYKGIIVKEKRIVRRTMELWHDSKLDIVDCYLIACLEGDRQNILYSYDRDFNKFKINRKEP